MAVAEAAVVWRRRQQYRQAAKHHRHADQQKSGGGGGGSRSGGGDPIGHHSKLHSKNSFVTELNIVIMLLCMCLQAYSTFIVSSPDHTLCYAKVGLVTLVDFLGVDLFLCRNSCRANQIAGRAIIT